MDKQIEAPALDDDGRHWVRTRHGWGWEVRGPNGYKSAAFGTQAEAMTLADRLNHREKGRA